MTWFEAYLLWNLDAIWGVATLFAVFSTILAIILWVFRTGIEPESDSGVAIKMVKLWSMVTLIVCLVSLPLAVFLPKTEQVLKIIATKKGVDAIQSDTAAKYLGEVNKTITNGLKVLNQEIEKKLDKKEAK